MTFTGTVVPPVLAEVTTADDMFSSSCEYFTFNTFVITVVNGRKSNIYSIFFNSASNGVILPTIIAGAVVVTLICIIIVIARKRKRANYYNECAAPQSIHRGALPSYAVPPPTSYSGTPSQSVLLDGWSSNFDSISTHEVSGNTIHASMDAPPSYESVARTNRQPVTPGGPSLIESAHIVPSHDSTLNSNIDNNQFFTEPRNNETTLYHASMAAQTNSPPSSTSLPPTYESYIAMQHKKS